MKRTYTFDRASEPSAEGDVDADLARFILAVTEPEPPACSHLDENALSLLELGAASAVERVAAMSHLSHCPMCRRLLSDRLREVPAVEQRASSGRGVWKIGRVSTPSFMRLAAAVLLTATVGVAAWSAGAPRRQLARAERAVHEGRPAEAIREAEPLLASGTESVRTRAATTAAAGYRALMADALGRSQFARVDELGRAAERHGMVVPALASLRAQAARAIPSLLALAYLDRLDQFGVPLQGSWPKGAKSLPGGPLAPPGAKSVAGDRAATAALAILDRSDSARSGDREAVLNNAHALLSSDSGSAAAAFAGWLRDNPGDRDALLGKALADFLNRDYAASADALEGLARAEPENLSIRINLAMALEAAGRPKDALSAWEAALRLTRDDALRKIIRARVSTLESGAGAR